MTTSKNQADGALSNQMHSSGSDNPIDIAAIMPKACLVIEESKGMMGDSLDEFGGWGGVVKVIKPQRLLGPDTEVSI